MLALRNLQRRVARTTIVSASVGLAVGSAMSLLTLADSIVRSAGQGVEERGADLTVLSRNAAEFFSGFIPEDMKTKLSQIPGVVATSGELIMFASIDHSQQKLVTAWPMDSFYWKQMPIASGHVPTADVPRGVVLGAGVAEALHKNVGDDLELLDARFRVVGIANYQSAFNRSIIFAPLAALQEVSFRKKQVTLFHLRLDPKLTSSRIEEIKSEVGRMTSLVATPTDQVLQRDHNIQITKAIARSVSLIALVMGALSVLNALLMAVQERTREIGIMMAIGWSKARTMASIILEAVFIGIAGSMVGVPLCFAITSLFQRLPTIGDILSFQLNVEIVLPALAASVVLSCIGALYPAWRAASMNPADALRRV
jgi:putative ABC transport system permease protein